MAKRLNKNLVVVLTLVGMGLTTAAGIVFVQTMPQKSPQPFVEHAEKLLAQKPPDNAQASTYYQRAAQRAKAAGDIPTMGKYLIKAGDLALLAGDSQRAMALWNTVMVADPTQVTAQERMVTFVLNLAEQTPGSKLWVELQDRAQKLVDAAEKNRLKSYVGLHALGRALIEQRAVKPTNLDEGKQRLVEAVNGDKSNPEFARTLATRYYLQRATDLIGEDKVSSGVRPEAAALIRDAVAVMDNLIQNLPQDPREQSKAYRYQGEILAFPVVTMVMPEADQRAVQALKKSAEADPSSDEAIVAMGSYYHRKKLASNSKTPPEEVDRFRRLARENYEQAIRLAERSFPAYLQLASLLSEDARFDDAMDVLDRRMQITPKGQTPGNSFRDRLNMNMLRDSAFRIGMQKYGEVSAKARNEAELKELGNPVLARIEKIYKDTAAENGERDALALFMLGRLLSLKGEAQGAIKALNDAEEQMGAGDVPEIQRLLGVMYAQTNAPGAAEKALTIATNANPNDRGALVLLAMVKNQLEKPEEAIQLADRVLLAEPENRQALQAKAQAFLAQKNYDAFRQTSDLLSRGLDEIRRKCNDAIVLRQESYTTGKVDEAKRAQAVKLFDEVLAREPYNNIALVNRVQLAIEMKQPEEAKKAVAIARAAADKKLQEVAQTQPTGEMTNNYRNLAVNLELMAINLDESIPESDRNKRREAVIRKAPDPFAVEISLYQMYAQAGDTDQAMTHIKEAYRLKPTEGAVLEPLFEMAITRKDWKLAEEVIDKSIAAGVEKTGGHFMRGRLNMERTDLPDNMGQAEREFRAALTELPELADAHAQLGRVLLAQNHVDQAKASYEKAIQLNPQNPYAVVGLALIAGAQGNEAEKNKYLNLAGRVAAGNPWVQSELLNQQDQRDPAAGIKRREELRKQNPKDVENLLRLADLYIRANDLKSAEGVYQGAIEADPNSFPAIRAYADFLWRGKEQRNSVKSAQEFLQKAVERVDAKDAPRKAAAQLLMANFLREATASGVSDAPRPPEIDAMYVAAAKLSPAANVRLTIGSHFAQTGNLEEALKWYREAAAAAGTAGDKDSQKMAQRLVIQSFLRSASVGKQAEALREIEAYRKQYSDDPIGMLFMGEYYTVTGRDDDAIKLYTDYITLQRDDAQGYYRRGFAYFRLGDWDRCVSDLREVKRLQPRFGDGQPRVVLAGALRQARNDEAAIAELQSVVEDLPDYRLGFEELFRVYLELKRFDSAENLIKAREGNSQSAYWDQLRQQLAVARGDMNAALKSATAAVEKSKVEGKPHPGAVQKYLLQLLSMKRYDEVITFVETGLPQDQVNDFTRVRLASAYAGKNNLAKCLEYYEKAVQTPPVDLVVLTDLMTGDEGLMRLRGAAIKELENRVKDSKNRTDRILLSVLYRVNGDFTGAARLAQELVDMTPEDTQANKDERTMFMRCQAVVLYEGKQWEPARTLYLKVLERNPNDSVALNNLAYLLMDQMNDPKAALPYARRVNDTISDNDSQKPNVLDTLGWNLVLLGEYDEAIRCLRRALEMNPNVAAIRYHCAEAHYGRSQKSNQSAGTDLPRAKTEVQKAHEILISDKADPESVGPKILALAGKLGMTLAAPPSTQAAQ